MAYRWTTNIDTPITVDGDFGPLSYDALQYGLGIDPQTGQFDNTTVVAFQTFLGVTADGDFGPVSTEALQTALNQVGGYGLTVDGDWGNATSSALQDALNQGSLANYAAPPQAPPPPPSGGVSWTASMAIDDKTAVEFTRYTGTGTVDDWIAGALAARGVTDPTAVGYWKTGYETIASRESSGDANACNTYDLNDVTPAGYSMVHDYGNGYGTPSGNLGGQLVNYQCSRGVVQCIPQTFAANHCPGTSNMIYDPVANIAASMGYVRVQYGVSADGHDLAALVQQANPNEPPKGY